MSRLPAAAQLGCGLFACFELILGLMAPADAAPSRRRPAPAPSVPGWPAAVREIRYRSPGDNSMQPALFYDPPGDAPRPLLVALHTWSRDHRQPTGSPYARWAMDRDWVFIHPNYRGPNVRPDATGSELVVADLLASVEWAQKYAKVDPDRIYLAGYSGGGHAALLMAGRAPHVWAGVSAWVPVTDLRAWYWEAKRGGHAVYASHVAASCGGIPYENSAAAEECWRRSPLRYLENARGLVPLDINAGIRDGHTGAIPISHSLRAFNLVAEPSAVLTPAQIRYFVTRAEVPARLRGRYVDPLYGKSKVLFRRESNLARITIFDGGHEVIREAGLRWLAKQRRTSNATGRSVAVTPAR